MSNRNNPRNGDRRRTEHGPHWENQNRADAQHVAKARKKYKQRKKRAERRTGKTPPWWLGVKAGCPVNFTTEDPED